LARGLFCYGFRGMQSFESARFRSIRKHETSKLMLSAR
jgi:hypothetical protein